MARIEEFFGALRAVMLCAVLIAVCAVTVLFTAWAAGTWWGGPPEMRGFVGAGAWLAAAAVVSGMLKVMGWRL